ncbi:MAG: adenylyl-sulfate kinase [Candidatus Omnitrophica bacterium]|nr:adenylyl-sulfate kinase [Candidatus Omnitrophota bacterium]
MENKSSNVVWHDHGIDKKQREERNGHKGLIIWFTGLPSSGKSTVASAVQKALFEKGCFTYILDGDNIRHGLNKDLGFSPGDREENIRRIGEVAKLFADAGAFALTAFVSPYRKGRDLVRELMEEGDFVEVYVKTSLEECEKRDVKGLYKKARCGEIPDFTGVSAPYEEPLKPEIIVDTDAESEQESAEKVLKYLRDNGYFK